MVALSDAINKMPYVPGRIGQLGLFREQGVSMLACHGQLRLAPSGQVIGIDMDAALQLAAARGYDLDVLSELLPATEAGLVDACGPTRNHRIEA
jgi:hypothetical protein